MKISSFNTALSFGISICILVLSLVTVAHATPPLPEWAVSGSAQHTWGAGCFIQLEGGVVLSISQHGTIQLPFGRAKDGDKTPQETAARETLEETGLTVEVHEPVALLAGDPQRVEGDTNQQILYRCTTVHGQIEYENLAANEVAEVLVVNPVTMLTPSGREIMAPWRFHTDRSMLIFLLEDRK